MEPLTVAAAATESTAGATAATEVAGAEAGLAFDAGVESAAEAQEVIVGEQGLIHQLDTVRFDSCETLSARNEAALNEVNEVFSVEENAKAGQAREATVHQELASEYPSADGNRIEQECDLRDEMGNIVLDPVTGEGRRLDKVVIRDGEVVKSVEVTSETAEKTGQMAKEERIREAGGNYIEDRSTRIDDRSTRKFVPFADGVTTEIWRRA